MYASTDLLSEKLTSKKSISSTSARLPILLVLWFWALVLLVATFQTFSGLPLKAASLHAERTSVVRFVSETGVDNANDCTLSTAPCKTVQYAIHVAMEDDEVHVAAGTYGGVMNSFIPDVGTVNATLILTKSISALLGGYSNDFASRNPVQNITILDGSNDPVEWLIFVGAVNTQIDGFTFTGIGESTTVNGGAVQINAGSPTLSHNLISENHSSFKGAGIYVSGGKPLIVSNQIVSNSARSGGGIYVLAGSVTITNNQIVGNSATLGHGGGIYVAQGSVLIAHNTIAQNQAISGTTGRGGGLFVKDGELVGIRGNLIYANQSSDGGSGIESNVGTEIYGNIVHHNQILVAGAAILLERTAQPITLTNNLVYKNLGSGITLRDFGSALIVNNTIHQNLYVSFGGPGNGIDVNTSVTPTVLSTALIFNNLLTNNEQCGIEAYNGVTLTNDYNALYNNKENLCNIALQARDSHNLDVEPHYASSATDNYRPIPGTAVVDKGTMSHAPALDLYGDPRPYGNGVDIGAIEAGPALVYLPLVSR